MNFKLIFTLCSVFLTIQALKSFDVIEKNFHASNIKSEALIKTYSIYDGTFRGYCGGVVIDPRFIISDYSCTRDSLKYDIAIGSDKVTEDGNTKWIQSDCHTYALYLEQTVNMTYLVFNEPINNGNVEVAKLPPIGSDVTENEIVYVATYGTFDIKEVMPEFDMEIREYKVEDRQKCKQKYEGLVNEAVFCYYGDKENEISRVDSSAPVYYKDNETVLGIEIYRDVKECTENKPILNYRFGHAELQGYIIELIDQLQCREGNIDSIHTEFHGKQFISSY